MSAWVLLAPGESMSAALADSVRGRAKVGAVGRCYQLAPWADFLAATDRAWWAAHPDALCFAGRRFSAQDVDGVQKLSAPLISSGSNSGLLALEAARRMGAQRIMLLGYDMRGTHYFGPYDNGLKNTPPDRYTVFQRQIAQWAHGCRGLEIVNCTPGSALTCFPHAPLEAALA